ncbi:MAG: FGGY family carbohydrate kinase, partial [Chitinophagales bacterium]
MTTPLVAGVDIGTSGVRCLVFDRAGALLSTSYREYPTISERAGWAELDPEAILDATITVIAEAAQAALAASPGGRIEAVGLSSALFSVMAVDSAGRPLTRVLPWMDNRAAGEAEELVASGLAQECYQRTGCRVHPMYPLSKLVWLRRHAPGVWQAARRFISIKEHVVEQLTGQRAVDYSVASSSGYFNIHTHEWDDGLLSLLGLEREQLSPPVDATTQAPLTAAAAGRLGLAPGTPLVWGAGDGMLAHLACGCFEPSRFSSTIGTSGALRVLARRPLLDDQARTWCYCFDAQTWVA